MFWVVFFHNCPRGYFVLHDVALFPGLEMRLYMCVLTALVNCQAHPTLHVCVSVLISAMY